MLKRVLENWLDKTSERALQLLYAYTLTEEGYTIIHISRHCPMEGGKDLIAIDPSGIPCAYQFKRTNNPRVKLKEFEQWEKELLRLVTEAIRHPSVDRETQHRSFFIVNKGLEDETQDAIINFNQGLKNRLQRDVELEVIVGGQILEKATKLGERFWPTDLKDFKAFLELFLEDGRGILPKEKLANQFETMLPFKSVPKTGKSEYCGRAISNAALLCATSISSFTNSKNYIAEIEAWTMYLAYVLALAEKWKLPSKHWGKELEISKMAIYNALANLCEELKGRQHFVEGNAIAEQPVYWVRLTWLLGYMSLYWLWLRYEKKLDEETDNFIREFSNINQQKMFLWGEAAIPQLLAYFWHLSKTDVTPRSDFLLAHLIKQITTLNKPSGDKFLASPYYEAEDILPYITGIADKPLRDSFRGNSYALEGLVHLFVRRNWKQNMKALWPSVTRLSFASFEPAEKWHFFRWRNPGEGIEKRVFTPRHQMWDELKEKAFESEGESIPETIKSDPILLLLFLFVYPHRMNADIMRWLDTQLNAI